MKQLRAIWVYVLLALVTVGVAQPAHAVLTLYLETGASTATVTDGNADGVVVFNGALGTFNVNVTTGLSKPVVPAPELMDLNSVNLSSTTGGTMTIRLADDNFTLGGIIDLIAAIGGTTAGTISYKLYIDDNNAFTITDPTTFGALACSGGPLGSGAFADTKVCSGNVTSPIALILEVVISQGSGTTSFDYNVSVPEPSAMLLFGLGLVGLGVWGRKRLRK